MTFLSIKEETYAALRKLRQKDETDDALIKRIVEYAKCYMIIQGAEDVDEGSKMTGDLYSACPECGSMDTKHIVGHGIPLPYKCQKCGHEFSPQFKITPSSLHPHFYGPHITPEIHGDMLGQQMTCTECGATFTTYEAAEHQRGICNKCHYGDQKK